MQRPILKEHDTEKRNGKEERRSAREAPPPLPLLKKSGRERAKERNGESRAAGRDRQDRERHMVTDPACSLRANAGGEGCARAVGKMWE